MKKSLLIAAVAGVFILSSCKKDYVCTCKETGYADWSITMNDMKKKDAEAACDGWNAIYTLSGDGPCTLSE